MFLQEGFQGYVAKPVELKLLEKVLQEHLPEHLLKPAEQQEQEVSGSVPAFSVSIEGIDYERGLSLFAGDRKQYLEIVKSVSEEGRRLAVEMSEALAAEEYKDYTIKIHALKGMMANIGADGFAKKAKALEMAGKEGDYDYIRRFHEEVIDEFETLAEGMDRLILSEEKEETDTDTELPEISVEELSGKIKEAKKYLEDYYRDEALDILQECFSFRLPDGVKKELKEMNDMVSQFQYQEPVEKADEILALLKKSPAS
jgi:HPt (histidine-containing phosphotransfer) domain-containing protein